MTELLYYRDAYLTECEGTVVGVEERGKDLMVRLDRTCLQPSHRDGGDKGWFVLGDGRELPVAKVVSDPCLGSIEHRVKARAERAVAPGAAILCKLDWSVRYPLMRRHSGNHLLYGLGKRLVGYGFPALSKTTLGDTYTKWTGQAGEIGEDLVREVFRVANEVIEEGRKVVVESLPREEALEKCGRYHEVYLPRSAEELRVVTIEGIDSDPCIGLHVRDVREIGEIRLVRIEREGEDLKVYSEVASR